VAATRGAYMAELATRSLPFAVLFKASRLLT
jgi:hypothetical protein